MNEHVSPSVILQRARRPESAGDIPALPLTLGVARFNPNCPTAVDQLLHDAMQSVAAAAPVTRTASPGHAPRPGVALC
jgi:hypothetical protein